MLSVTKQTEMERTWEDTSEKLDSQQHFQIEYYMEEQEGGQEEGGYWMINGG